MRRIIGALLFTGLVCGGGWAYWRQGQAVGPHAGPRNPVPEPIVQGKPLSTWVAQLKEPDVKRRQAALIALGQLGPRAQPATAAIIEANWDKDTQFLAAGALGMIGSSSIPPVVSAWKEKMQSSRVELDAFHMKHPLGGHEDEKILVARLDLYERCKVMPEWLTRTLVCYSPEMAPALAEVYRTDNDPGVRLAVIRALSIVAKDPMMKVPLLTEALADSAAGVRHAAIRGLAEEGADARPALTALRKALTDENADVSQEAQRTLLRIEAPAAQAPCSEK